MKREDFIKLIDKIENKEVLFWQNEYPRMDMKGKINFWLSGIHQGMRSMNEIGNDEYTHFNKKWYKRIKTLEPNFDEILEKLVPRLNIDFDWESYRKCIKS